MNKQKLINIAKANGIKYYYDYNKSDLQKRILNIELKKEAYDIMQSTQDYSKAELNIIAKA